VILYVNTHHILTSLDCRSLSVSTTPCLPSSVTQIRYLLTDITMKTKAGKEAEARDPCWLSTVVGGRIVDFETAPKTHRATTSADVEMSMRGRAMELGALV
jgi:hypothetical protein